MLEFVASIIVNGLKRIPMTHARVKIAVERDTRSYRTRGGEEERTLAKDEEGEREKSKSIRGIAQWLEGVKTIGSRLSVSAFPR